MSTAPMPAALLAQLKMIAKARGLTDPDKILAAAEAKRKPKPVLYWANPDKD